MNEKLIRTILTGATALIISVSLFARQSQTSQQTQTGKSDSSMSGMDMPDMQHENDAAKTANDSMSGHMDMGAHMYMTSLRTPNPDDQKRAAEIVEMVGKSIEKYKDYRVALADGFKPFFPNVRQDVYHFTNYRYGAESQFEFNPEHPTSLLYTKVSGGYELVGAMFTAPKKATEDELNQRVPLSVARWHKHVNFCLPPRGTPLRDVNLNEFGMRGSIATEEACNAAGGRWFPQVFGWMVHVYPYETDPTKIWAH